MKSIIVISLFIIFSITSQLSSNDSDTYYNKDRPQSPYPDPANQNCGSWAMTENVCCACHCDNIESTEGCGQCGGQESEHCVVDDAKSCKSGTMDNIRAGDFAPIPDKWHFSRSTHFGLTFGGACGFGLYQVCGKNLGYTGETESLCNEFCTNFPDLCAEPEGISYRGNFAAPQGNYYTQFWGALEGDYDNYLSCGECFEVIRTKNDGTDFQEGEEGYQKPVILSVIDSCPCSANTKWCCGSGQDQCQEVSYMKYGCPTPEDSIHLDLSDVAMARLQTGKPDGFMVEGILPMRYKRVPCPHTGNMFIWLRPDAGPYWFAFTIVNSAGFGGIAVVEARNDNGEWKKLIHDPNYSSSRPQERYGNWVVPQGVSVPFNLPVSLRITDGSGEVLTIEDAIKSFDKSENAIGGTYNYIDLGTNFPEIKADYSDISN